MVFFIDSLHESLCKKVDINITGSIKNDLDKIINGDLTNIQAQIFTSGHRNPQGITKIQGEIFSVEHGPQGGDELNKTIYQIISKDDGKTWTNPRNIDKYLSCCKTADKKMKGRLGANNAGNRIQLDNGRLIWGTSGTQTGLNYSYSLSPNHYRPHRLYSGTECCY